MPFVVARDKPFSVAIVQRCLIDITQTDQSFLLCGTSCVSKVAKSDTLTIKVYVYDILWKVTPWHVDEGTGYGFNSVATLALEGSRWSAQLPGCFTPGKELIRLVHETGWASGPVCTCTENCALTGILISDRPAHSESLYPELYCGRHYVCSVLGTSVWELYSVLSNKKIWEAGDLSIFLKHYLSHLCLTLDRLSRNGSYQLPTYAA